MNHSPITNKLFNEKTKKAFIKGLSAAAASAMLLTSAGCGFLPPDTTDTTEISKDTQPDHKVTSPLDEFAHVEGYVSDLANDIINDPKLEEYKQDFEDTKITAGTYGTKYNPTNYDYFHKLYPNATDEEILKYTKVHYEFYGTAENSLYVIFISHPDLSDNVSGDPSYLERYLVYSLIEYTGLTKEEQRDLIKSIEDKNFLHHSLMLNKISNNKNYKVLAENLRGITQVRKSSLGFYEEGLTDITFATTDAKNDRKLIYSLIKDESTGFYNMYFSTADLLPTDKSQQERDLKVEHVTNTLIGTQEKHNNTYEYDNIFYERKLASISIIDYVENKTTP